MSEDSEVRVLKWKGNFFLNGGVDGEGSLPQNARETVLSGKADPRL